MYYIYKFYGNTLVVKNNKAFYIDGEVSNLNDFFQGECWDINGLGTIEQSKLRYLIKNKLYILKLNKKLIKEIIESETLFKQYFGENK